MTRLAYIIGVNNYEKWEVLNNPINDAKIMGEVLTKSGFDVKIFEDLNYEKFSQCIYEFGCDLNNYNTGLFYFAGHGIEIDGKNYLVPTNAEIQSVERIAATSINISNLIEQMRGFSENTHILILDSCRINVSLSGGRGLKQTGLNNINAPKGTFISYSTSPNSTASDGNGNNGMFTKVLSNYLLQENIKIEELFKKVRIEVQEQSSGHQIPWEHSSLIGDFYFVESKPRFSEKFILEKSLIDIIDIMPHYSEKREYDDYLGEYKDNCEEEEENIDKTKQAEQFNEVINQIQKKVDSLNYQEFYILSKTKTKAYRTNTFQWWAIKDGYTDDLNEARIFTKEEIKEKIHPYNHMTTYTKSVAIPSEIVEETFDLAVIPYNDKFLRKLDEIVDSVVGDLVWNLPRIMY